MDEVIRVLYVDDEPTLLNITRLFMEKDGMFAVTTCESPEKALVITEREQFDAIISDYQMPGMNGIELLKKIRGRGDTTSFIIFTGRGREDVVIDALNSGADFYLQKGGDPRSQFTELGHKVRLAVEKRRTEYELSLIHREIGERLQEEKIVSEFSQYLLTATSIGEVLDYFGDRIQGISGADYLMLAKFNPAANTIGIHSLRGVSSFLPGIGRLVQGSLESLHVPMDFIRAKTDLMPLGPGLKKIDGGVYQMTRGYLPKAACSGIELLLDVKTIYLYELVLNDILYGSITFGFKKGSDIRNPALVTTMSNLLASGLWRIYSADAIAAEQHSLAESEEKWRSLVDNSLDGIIIISFTGTLLFANKRAGEFLWGRTVPELIGKINMLDVLSAESKVRAIADIAKVWSGIDSYLVSYRAHTQARGDMAVHCIGKKIMFDQAPAILLSIHDVTLQKAAEDELLHKNDALRQSEERFRELSDLLPQIVFETDTELNVIFANQHGLELFGLSEKDLTEGLNALRFIDPSQLESLKKDIPRLVRGDTTVNHDFTMIRNDGSSFPALVYAAPVFRDGSLAGFRGIAVDITDRKIAERSMQESEKKYRRMIDTSLEGICIVDSGSRISYINSRMTELLGYGPEELAGRNAADFIHPDDRDGFLQTMNERRRGVSTRFERRYIRKDGTIRTLQVSGTPVIDDTGTYQGAFAMLMDVTDRKKAEDALLHANRQLKLMTSITRHDIDNMITAILGYLSLAGELSSDPTMQEFIGEIESATKAIRSHIAFTKIYQDLGTREPRWQELDALLARLNTPASVRMTTRVFGISVHADPMLENVFPNLLDNSIRHGGHVSEISIFPVMENGNLTIVWEDNGAGIPAGEKEKIFERGYGKNTGLGLFLVREILALTGITIRENGAEGSGARFEIVVPEQSYRSGQAPAGTRVP